jgi:peptide/nickel transport system substrate-binding protein
MNTGGYTVKIKEKMFLFAASILLCIFTLSPANAQKAVPESAKYGGTLTIAIQQNPKTLDPLYAGGTGSWSYQGTGYGMIWEPLIDYGTNLKDKPVPGLAESWKQLDDTTWLVHLRKGVKFHNGKELTAEDVKTTHEWKAKKNFPKDLKPPKGGTHSMMIKDIEIVDKYTLKFILKYPYRILPVQAFRNVYVLDPDVTKKWGREAGLHPNGTGPFKFKEYVSGSHLILERNENYWGKRPYVDRIIMRVIPDATTRLLALQAGEVDVAVMEPSSIPSIEKDSKLTIYRLPQVLKAEGGVWFNMRRWPMNQLKFRHAVAMGADWIKFAKIALPYDSANIQRTFLQGSWAYNKEHEKLRPSYNPQKARQLIREVEAEAGKTIPPIYVLVAEKPLAEAVIFQMAAPALKNIGVTLDLHIFEPNTANTKFSFDPKMEWDMSLAEAGGVGIDPYFGFGYYLSDTRRAPDDTNPAGYKNPQFDKLARSAIATSNQNEAKRFNQEAEKILLRDLPCLPLFSSKALWGINKRVHGFRPHDSGWLFPNHLWIEK